MLRTPLIADLGSVASKISRLLVSVSGEHGERGKWSGRCFIPSLVCESSKTKVAVMYFHAFAKAAFKLTRISLHRFSQSVLSVDGQVFVKAVHVHGPSELRHGRALRS